MFEEVSNIPKERIKKSKASQNFAGTFQIAYIILLSDHVPTSTGKHLMLLYASGVS